MLARTPKVTSIPLDERLVLPSRPDAIRETEERHLEASAARQAGQIRHIEANRQYGEQLLGMPPTITRADVDAIGVALGALFTAEAEADAARKQAIADYSAAVDASLAQPLSDYRAALANLLDQLDELTSAGVRLHQQSVASKVTLPRLVALSRDLQRIAHDGRRILASAK